MKAMLEVGQGHSPELPKNVTMSEGDIMNINNYFNLLLDRDPKEATVDELITCLNPENAVERIAYRKEVGSKAKT